MLKTAAQGVGEIKVDPRLEVAKDRDAENRKLLESMPKAARDLMSEHARLSKIDKVELTREERIRLAKLGAFEGIYQTLVKRIKMARERGTPAWRRTPGGCLRSGRRRSSLNFYPGCNKRRRT